MTEAFVPGTLWPQTQQTFARALERGALQPIPTDYEWIEQDGVQFLVRIVDNLRRKDLTQARRDKGLTTIKKKDQDFNPFLPYDPELFVCDLSSTHLVLLNKFNVMDHHILIVTRAFESQVSWLTLEDFQAFSLAAQEIDGLGFYNAGTLAGASQRHKHFQLVPTPLASGGPKIPFSPWIDQAIAQGLTRVPQFSFRHLLTPLPNAASAAQLLSAYEQLMPAIGMGDPQTLQHQLGAYNLLITRAWMMAIPRSQERFDKISINALGFSGALLVKTNDHLKQLRQIGPMTLLKAVGA